MPEQLLLCSGKVEVLPNHLSRASSCLNLFPRSTGNRTSWSRTVLGGKQSSGVIASHLLVEAGASLDHPGKSCAHEPQGLEVD